VGVIVAPHCRLIIRPKLPLTSLFHLLDPAAPLPVFADATTPEPGTAALEFLASRLAGLMTERAAAGLHRGYSERADQGPFLQGRLDVAAQIADPSGRKDQLHRRYEEFSVDVPCNQATRATAERLLLSPLLPDGVKTSLRRALQDFAAVSSVPLSLDLFAAAEPDRLTESYRPLLALCRLLADSLDPGEAAGDAACPAFLIDMEGVFERYVTDGVLGAFETSRRHRVEVQPLFTVSPPMTGQPGISMRPDVLIRDESGPVLVIDAKWKRLQRSALPTSDLYQVLAYGGALGVPRLALVYPGQRNRIWEYAFVGGPVQLRVIALNVVGTRERCERSRQALGRRLLAWANS
jgi:5-methylcytosine-specific restriction enzyme subunit McrC